MSAIGPQNFQVEPCIRILSLLFADDVMFFSSMSLVIELGVRRIVAFLCARNNSMSVSGEFEF